MALFVAVSEFAIQLIGSLGYSGVVFLMALESMIFPVPSEAVMPFVGFLVANGTFDFWPALIASVLGTLLGSFLSYYLGLYLGYFFVKKAGKYFLLEEAHLEWSNNWFKKYGHVSVFFARLVPVIRHVISIAAGIAKMNKTEFLIFTALGGTLWNGFLLYAGIKLENNWAIIKQYSEPIDLAVIVFLVL